MESYLTEEERVEALQRWWKTNSRSVFTGICLGLAVIFGYSMWQKNKQATAGEASALYSQLLSSVQEKQLDSATTQAERIVAKYPNTAYADYSQLFLAKTKVEKGDLPAARKVLEDMLAKSSDNLTRQVARLRLLRVMNAQGQSDAALKVAEAVTDKEAGKLAGLYADLKGDLYAAANRPDDARKAYQRAKELGGLSGFIDLKLDNLPAAGSAGTP